MGQRKYLNMHRDSNRIIGLRLTTYINENLIKLHQSGDQRFGQIALQSAALLTRTSTLLEANDRHRVMYVLALEKTLREGASIIDKY